MWGFAVRMALVKWFSNICVIIFFSIMQFNEMRHDVYTWTNKDFNQQGGEQPDGIIIQSKLCERCLLFCCRYLHAVLQRPVLQ